MKQEEIKKILPHRDPFLFVDEIIEQTEDSITGVRQLTGQEEFFKGHFPGNPIFPGVLMIEALAQTAGVLALQKTNLAGAITFFAGVDGVRWKRPVKPGDKVILKTVVKKLRVPLIICSGQAMVGDEVACEIEDIKLMLAPEERKAF